MDMDLFDTLTPSSERPLAEVLRPGSINELLLTAGGDLSLLYKAWASNKKSSHMLYGPAGSGKTSFIKLLFNDYDGFREQVNAVDIGIPKLRELLKAAEGRFKLQGKPTLIFVDEAHRLKAPQQDIFLPALEAGSILFLGATTENPGFRFNRAFLSRMRLVRVEPLSKESLKLLILRGLKHLDFQGVVSEDLEEALIYRSGGDGRRLLGDLNSLVNLFSKTEEGLGLDEPAALKYLELEAGPAGSESLKVDGLSALIKSMRASDEKASVYYMGLLLRANEDPEVMLRRMLIFTAEDIGNANPQATVIVNAIWEGYLKVGMPEAAYSLYQACSYLAKSPKSRRQVEQKFWADQNVDENLDANKIPKHLRNKGSEAIEGKSNLPENLSGK